MTVSLVEFNQHEARRNLRADHAAQVRSLLGSIEAIGALCAAGYTSHHVLGAVPKRQDPASLISRNGRQRNH